MARKRRWTKALQHSLSVEIGSGWLESVWCAHSLVIKGQDRSLVIVDGPGILPYVAGVVNPARKLGELASLDRLQRPHADFGGAGDLFKGDSPIPPDCR